MGWVENKLQAFEKANEPASFGDYARNVGASFFDLAGALPAVGAYAANALDQDMMADDLQYAADAAFGVGEDIRSYNTEAGQRIAAARFGSEDFWRHPFGWVGLQAANTAAPIVAGVVGAIVAGPTVGMLINAGVAGTHSAGITYNEMIKDLDNQDLSGNKLFNGYLQQGMSRQEALRQFKKDAITYKPAALFAVTALLARYSAPGIVGSKLNPTLAAQAARDTAQKGIFRRVGEATALSAGEEGTQNTLEDLASQSVRVASGAQEGIEGGQLFEAAGAGAVLGAALGAGAGIPSGRSRSAGAVDDEDLRTPGERYGPFVPPGVSPGVTPREPITPPGPDIRVPGQEDGRERWIPPGMPRSTIVPPAGYTGLPISETPVTDDRVDEAVAAAIDASRSVIKKPSGRGPGGRFRGRGTFDSPFGDPAAAMAGRIMDEVPPAEAAPVAGATPTAAPLVPTPTATAPAAGVAPAPGIAPEPEPDMDDPVTWARGVLAARGIPQEEIDALSEVELIEAANYLESAEEPGGDTEGELEEELEEDVEEGEEALPIDEEVEGDVELPTSESTLAADPEVHVQLQGFVNSIRELLGRDPTEAELADEMRRQGIEPVAPARDPAAGAIDPNGPFWSWGRKAAAVKYKGEVFSAPEHNEALALVADKVGGIDAIDESQFEVGYIDADTGEYVAYEDQTTANIPSLSVVKKTMRRKAVEQAAATKRGGKKPAAEPVAEVAPATELTPEEQLEQDVANYEGGLAGSKPESIARASTVYRQKRAKELGVSPEPPPAAEAVEAAPEAKAPPKKLTLKTVNEEIQRRGHTETLYRDKGGFYYFDGPETGNWPRTIIETNSLNTMDLNRWMEALEGLRAEAAAATVENETPVSKPDAVKATSQRRTTAKRKGKGKTEEPVAETAELPKTEPVSGENLPMAISALPQARTKPPAEAPSSRRKKPITGGTVLRRGAPKFIAEARQGISEAAAKPVVAIYRRWLRRKFPGITKEEVAGMAALKYAALTNPTDTVSVQPGEPLIDPQELARIRAEKGRKSKKPTSKSKGRKVRKPRILQDTRPWAERGAVANDAQYRLDWWETTIATNIQKTKDLEAERQRVIDEEAEKTRLREEGKSPKPVILSADPNISLNARIKRVNAASREIFDRHASVEQDTSDIGQLRRRVAAIAKDAAETEAIEQERGGHWRQFTFGVRRVEGRGGAHTWLMDALRLNRLFDLGPPKAGLIRQFLQDEAILRAEFAAGNKQANPGRDRALAEQAARGTVSKGTGKSADEGEIGLTPEVGGGEQIASESLTDDDIELALHDYANRAPMTEKEWQARRRKGETIPPAEQRQRARMQTLEEPAPYSEGFELDRRNRGYRKPARRGIGKAESFRATNYKVSFNHKTKEPGVELSTEPLNLREEQLEITARRRAEALRLLEANVVKARNALLRANRPVPGYLQDKPLTPAAQKLLKAWLKRQAREAGVPYHEILYREANPEPVAREDMTPEQLADLKARRKGQSAREKQSKADILRANNELRRVKSEAAAPRSREHLAPALFAARQRLRAEKRGQSKGAPPKYPDVVQAALEEIAEQDARPVSKPVPPTTAVARDVLKEPIQAYAQQMAGVWQMHRDLPVRPPGPPRLRRDFTEFAEGDVKAALELAKETAKKGRNKYETAENIEDAVDEILRGTKPETESDVPDDAGPGFDTNEEPVPHAKKKDRETEEAQESDRWDEQDRRSNIAKNTEGSLLSPFSDRLYIAPQRATNVRTMLAELNLNTPFGRSYKSAMRFLRNRLVDAVGDIPIYVVDQFDLQTYLGPYYQGHLAAYIEHKGDPSKDFILMGSDVMGGSNFKKVWTTLHEVVHAATVARVATNPALHNRLNQLMTAVHMHHGMGRKDLGFDNVFEFIAEAMTNPVFQKLLLGTPLSRSLASQFKAVNAFQAFIQFVRRALRGPQEITSALEAAVSAFEEITTPATKATSGSTLGGAVAHGFKTPRELGGTAVRSIREMYDHTGMQKQMSVPKALFLAGLDQLARTADRFFGGADNNPIRKIYRHLTNIAAQTALYQKQAEALTRKIVAAEKKAGSALWAEFGEFLNDETNANVFADRPLAMQKHLGKDVVHSPSLGSAQAAVRHADLRRRYDDLMRRAPYLGEIRNDLHTFYRKRQRLMSHYLVHNILVEGLRGEVDPKDVSDALVTRILDKQVTEADAKLLGADLTRRVTRARELMAMKGPYVPLMRRGKWVVRAVLKVVAPATGLNGTLKSGTTNVYEFRGDDARQRAMDYAASLDEHAWVTGKTIDEATGESWEEDADGEVPGTRHKITLKDPGSIRVFQVEVQDDYVEFFDSKNAALKEADDLTRDPDVASVKEVQERRWSPGDRGVEFLSSDVTNLMTALEKRQGYQNMPAQMQSLLRQSIQEFGLQMMGSTRVHKRRIMRRHVGGASLDTTRNFIDYTQSVSSYTARLEFAQEMNEAMRELEAAVDAGPEGRGLGRRAIANEVKKRIDAGNGFDQGGKFYSPFVQRLMTTSFIARLGSPMYTIMNLMQVPMVAMPVISARHKVGPTMRAISKAYKDLGAGGVLKKGAKETYRKGRHPTSDTLTFVEDMKSKVNSREAEVFDFISPRGGLEIAKLQKVQNPHGGVLSEVGSYGDTALTVLEGIARQLPTAAEAINRGVVLLAAYRLEYARNGGDHKAALRYADDTNNMTNFNYSEVNAPPAFNHPLMRIPFQFKRFGHGMYQLLGQQLGRAWRNESPGARKEALKSLAYLMATHTLMAGTLGLPTEPIKGIVLGLFAMGVIGFNWQDFEDAERALAADLLGKDLGEVLTRGITRSLPFGLAFDMSSRVGMADLFLSREPNSGQPDEIKTWLTDMLIGAPGQMLFDFQAGAREIVAGDWSSGLSKVVPIKAMRDLIKAIDVGMYGKQTKSGRPTLDPYSFSEMFIRAIGATPEREAESQELKAQFYSEQAYINEKRGDLQQRWADASRADRLRMQGEIERFNRGKPREAQLTRAVLSAYASRRKTEITEMEGGVRPTKSNRYVLDRAMEVYNQ